ncbi:hypothetical protein [Streptomyces ehimensis]|uniref:Uncharacterized protein n=1 Tax=Streptomyces ehimensis TaxID=68195 RepID=A0ABV9BUS3_9ACTN
MTTAHPRGRALGRGLHTLISPGPEPAADEPTMDLTTGAAPGVEEHADAAAEAACRLADSAHATGWSATAVEDAVDAIDYLVEALSTLAPPRRPDPRRRPDRDRGPAEAPRAHATGRTAGTAPERQRAASTAPTRARLAR